jgi:superfamily II DNA or RNA helicase
MKLRPIQHEAVDAVFREWESVNSTLMVCPTGFGKTVCMAEIIRRARAKDIAEFPDYEPGLAMVLAHRTELIDQSVDKISRVTGLRCEIEMADKRVFGNDLFGACDVVVSSIQTQNAGGDGGGRMSKFLPDHFSILLIDEAHHACSPSYRRVIDYYRQNPNLKVFGCTATPDRADEEALGQVFDSVAFDYEIADAIKDGWLVDIEQRLINVSGLDFSGVRTTAGDLNGGDLAAIMEAEKNLHGIAGPSIEIIAGKKAIAFTASVKQAEMLCEIFNRHDPGMAAWVCGETDKDERRKILSDFAIGRIQIVCNCGVLTEGFDDAGVDFIIMARPTKSRSLYAQMAGRAIRPHGSIAHSLNDCEDAAGRHALIAASPKPKCEVIDFVGNAGKHKLMTTADILGGNYSDEAIERAVTSMKKSGQPQRMNEAIEEAEEEIRLEREERRRLDEARRMKLLAKASYTSQSINPFDVYHIAPAQERGWDKGKCLTEKQRDILLKQGIDPDKMPYHQAKQLLTETFKRWDAGLCSFKQAQLLQKRGLPTNVSREEATRLINEIAAKEGWKKR